MTARRYFRKTKPVRLIDIFRFIWDKTPGSQNSYLQRYGISLKELSILEMADEDAVSENRPLNIYVRTLENNPWLLKRSISPEFSDLFKAISSICPEMSIYEMAQLVGGGAQNAPRWLKGGNRLRPAYRLNIEAILAIIEKDGRKGFDQFVSTVIAEYKAAGINHSIKDRSK